MKFFAKILLIKKQIYLTNKKVLEKEDDIFNRN